MTAPVKNETVDGVEVPVTTPAWAIKGAAVLLAVAGPVLDAWNPWHLNADAAKAAVLCVFVAFAAVAFFGQTLVAAVHRQGWSLKTLENVAGADKDEAKVLLDELRPVAEQAKPVLDAAKEHSSAIASAAVRLDALEARARKLEQTPGLDLEAVKTAIVAALTGKPETPASAPVSAPAAKAEAPAPKPAAEAPAPVQPAEVSTGGTP